jgi:hypothetical protein
MLLFTNKYVVECNLLGCGILLFHSSPPKLQKSVELSWAELRSPFFPDCVTLNMETLTL